MQRARERLEKAEREPSVEAQRQAEQKLREAIDRLERILRQLREEEVKRQLAKIETRLREIAERQATVLDKTRDLAQRPLEGRDRQTDVRAGNLAFEEKKIAADTDRALLLLQEEGSARAFPEVLLQVRTDMLTVADRLGETKIDEITQGIQEDILATLEEMIESLQQQQMELEQQQQQQQQNSSMAGQPGEQPLVDQLAELRLVKTQQQRIKRSTERYGEMLGDAGPDGDVRALLHELSDRQSKLYRVVRDIAAEEAR